MFMMEHKAKRSVLVITPRMEDSNRWKRKRFLKKNVSDMIEKPNPTKKIMNYFVIINCPTCGGHYKALLWLKFVEPNSWKGKC